MSEEQSTPQENYPQNQGQQPFNTKGQFPPQNGSFQYGMQQSLPNATAVLVLGILAIIGCCCYGLPGVILAIIALVLGKKDRADYALNPTIYTESSYKNLNAGRICAIIGLILSILYLLVYIVLIAVLGFGVLSDPNVLQDVIKDLQ